MFFRRQPPHVPTFEERLDSARQAGFTVETLGAGSARVRREGCAATIAGGRMEAGLVMGEEVGRLVDGGFQKFFQTPSGKRKPALADELKAIHRFQEDLREALGLTSLYNESLGTVSTFYRYDRLKDRDQGVPKRVWEN